MKFTNSFFWVQVHDMPLLCMNKGVGTKIIVCGSPRRCGCGDDRVGWGSFLRVHVNIDLHKPLESGRALNVGG